VSDEYGQPISAAQVVLASTPVQRGTTDARGNLRLTRPPAGTYALRVTATGFRIFSQSLRLNDQKAVNISLERSAGAFHVIGSVTGHANTPFNATPVAQHVYPREAYRDQGQPDVTSVLNQTPGAFALTSTSTNTATPLSPAFASVRNGLPFETPVLIDGEPILTPSGTLDLSLLPTYVLQEVEIVKGAGDVAGAGGGAGGAVNFRTAEPTLGQRGTFETEGDSQGGSFTDLAYDGTQPGGVLAYASMLSVDGSPCCDSDPSDYARKAVLIKLRETPSTGVSITETALNVVLNRSLDSIYGLSGFGYEHLTFADVAASVDRGGDAFSLRTFLAQTQTGTVSPNVLPQPTDGEYGVTLGWQHTSGKLAFDTSGRVVNESLLGVNAYQTQSSLDENLTYKPNARDELDLSGALNAYNTTAGTVDGPSARIAYAHTLHTGLAVRASYGTSAVAPPLEAIVPYVSAPFPTTSSVTSIERATGGDFGLEWRLHGNTTTFSAGLYHNNTQNAYAYSLGSWYNGPPMVESGAEFSLQQFKRVGMGFIAALQLPRTYVWGATGGTLYGAQNLGYGAIAPFRIPYAQGYAEISYKWPRGSRASIGALYVGSNNAYGAPAFATLNSNLEISLGGRAKLQFSAENLTNQLANRAPIFGPVPQYGLVPFTLRFMFRQSFGTGSLYEH